jgi:hypothetical protein
MNAKNKSMNNEDSDSFAGLKQEYQMLINELKKPGRREDVAILMRLTVVMMDLNLYLPSPP